MSKKFLSISLHMDLSLRLNDPIILLHFIFRVRYWSYFIQHDIFEHISIKRPIKGIISINNNTFLKLKSFFIVTFEERQNQTQIFFLRLIIGKLIKLYRLLINFELFNYLISHHYVMWMLHIS